MKKFIFLGILVFFTANVTAQVQALARVNHKRDFGFINKKGEMVIPAKFDKAGDFSDGLAAAYDGGWGYIDPSGAWAIQPQFDKAKSFDHGVALVEKDGAWMYIDKSGKKLNIAKGDKLYDFHEGVAFVRKGDLVGLMNTQGTMIAAPEFKKITAFHHGYARILSQSDQWGIIDNKGNIVVEPKYDDIGPYIGKIAWVRNEGQLGLVTGNNYTEIDAVKIWDFSQEGTLTYAKKDDLIGFMNKKGEWVIPPTFEKAKGFSNGLAPAYADGKWGYVDIAGEFVIEPQYEDAEIFSKGGLAPVRIDGDWGFINTKGDLVIEAKYEISIGGSGGFGFMKAIAKDILNISNQKGFVNGVARVGYKRDFAYIDQEGKVLGDTWYDRAEPFVKIE